MKDHRPLTTEESAVLKEFAQRTNAERVPGNSGCSRCGEDRMDWLIWQEDGETVHCTTCGFDYKVAICPEA